MGEEPSIYHFIVILLAFWRVSSYNFIAIGIAFRQSHFYKNLAGFASDWHFSFEKLR